MTGTEFPFCSHRLESLLCDMKKGRGPVLAILLRGTVERKTDKETQQ